MEGRLFCSSTRRLTLLCQVGRMRVVGAANQLVHVIVIVCCTCTPSADMVHSGLVPSSSKHRMQRVIATDGTTEPLTGVCVFFLRPNTSKPVSTANMVEVGDEYIK